MDFRFETHQEFKCDCRLSKAVDPGFKNPGFQFFYNLDNSGINGCFDAVFLSKFHHNTVNYVYLGFHAIFQ